MTAGKACSSPSPKPAVRLFPRKTILGISGDPSDAASMGEGVVGVVSEERESWAAGSPQASATSSKTSEPKTRQAR
jgi:hypothetical protein